MGTCEVQESCVAVRALRSGSGSCGDFRSERPSQPQAARPTCQRGVAEIWRRLHRRVSILIKESTGRSRIVFMWASRPGPMARHLVVNIVFSVCVYSGILCVLCSSRSWRDTEIRRLGVELTSLESYFCVLGAGYMDTFNINIAKLRFMLWQLVNSTLV